MIMYNISADVIWFPRILVAGRTATRVTETMAWNYLVEKGRKVWVSDICVHLFDL